MTILVIAGMALITFLLRFVPLLLVRKSSGSEKSETVLDHLPLAMLSALIVPGIFQVDQDTGLVGIAAGAVAVILVLIRKMPMYLVIMGSVAAAVVVKLITIHS